MLLSLYRSHVRSAFALALPLLLLAAGMHARAAGPPHDAATMKPHAPVSVRVADASCARCHAAIVRQYLGSPKSNASGNADERLHPGSFTHAASGVRYQVLDAASGPDLRYAREGEQPLAGTHTLAYFLGSGHLGTTYLYTEDGYLLESPVAWYARLNTFAMAPGLAASTTMPEALPMTPGCMRCHMSGVQAADPGTRNRFTGAGAGDALAMETAAQTGTPAQLAARTPRLPFTEGGITCERCHGDSTAHVASGGHAPILNPIKLAPAARDSVCSSCHLEGDTSVERRGRSVLDWHPGDDLANDVSYFVLHGGTRAGERATDRSVSETEQLALSRCKRESGAQMSCMSCHDPHGAPAPADRVAFYRAKCLACHSAAPAFAATHFPATPDCTSCHMPKSGAADTPHVAWTDHRLRQRPDAPLPDAPAAEEPLTMRTALDTPATPRDTALGYYKLLLKRQRAFAPKAWTMLNQAARADPTDVPVLVALGYLNQLQGRATDAMQLYRDALRLEPENLEASNDLGMLLAQAGQMNEARALWQASFARNADVASLGMNLSIARCGTGDRAGAETTLEEVLRFSPDDALVRRRLAALHSGTEVCAQPASPVGTPASTTPGR